jgi:dTDP-4-amino-4,6-dideoxygalactose transaminase
LDRDIWRAWQNIVDSGIYTSADFDGGPYVQKFENSLTEYIGQGTVTVNSGTSGLIAALELAGVGPGDYVAAPGFTFKATWNAVKAVGATVIPVDVTEEDFTIDLNHLDRIIQQYELKAIITVHLYGHYAKSKEIKALYPDIPLIEDACQALGTKYEGRQVGTFGDFGVFSFYPSKIINTMEGGAVTCKRPHEVRSIRNHGNGDDRTFLSYGLNLRMTEFSAAMGYYQMKHIEEDIAKRRALKAAYENIFKEIQWTEQGLYFSRERKYERRNGQLFTVCTPYTQAFEESYPSARCYYDYCLPACRVASNLIHKVRSLQLKQK